MNTTFFPLSNLEPHAVEILRYMRRRAESCGRDPMLRAVALEIVGPIRDNALRDAAQRLYLWVQQAVTYIPDMHGSEYVIDPQEMLAELADTGRVSGDCDDHVLLFCSLARAIGLDARPVGVSEYGNPEHFFDHVIAVIRFPEGDKDYDICAKEVWARDYTERLEA